MKIVTVQNFLLASSLLVANACTEARSQTNADSQFKVSVQNVTAGNLLSPYLVILHKPNTFVFKLGDTASAGLQQVAETGATDIIQSELAANPNIIPVSKAEGMPLASGETRDVPLTASQSQVDEGTVVTVIAMIGKSNDSFIAASHVPLSSFTMSGYKTDAKNYDAGTEQNTGNVEDLNATSHPVEVVEGKISSDRGLNPNGNAPEILRWGSVAAQVNFVKM